MPAKTACFTGRLSPRDGTDSLAPPPVGSALCRTRCASPRPAARSPGRAVAAGWLLAGLALVVSGDAALAQGRLDADALKTFGGTYRVSCADANSPTATVAADALRVAQGSKKVTGRNVQSAASYLGPNMPPEFRSVLLSEVGSAQLLFVVYEDAAGYYLTLDGDPKIVATIGKPLARAKFRRCDGGTRPARTPAAPRRCALHDMSAPGRPKRESQSAQHEGSPVSAPGRPKRESQSAQHEGSPVSAAGLLQDPRAKAAYYRSLGTLVREPWLAQLDGPSPQNRQIRVASIDFILASACKNHDCAEFNTVLLYAAAENVVYDKVFQRGRATLIGTPPPAVAGALERLWRAEWRRGR